MQSALWVRCIAGDAGTNFGSWFGQQSLNYLKCFPLRAVRPLLRTPRQFPPGCHPHQFRPYHGSSAPAPFFVGIFSSFSRDGSLRPRLLYLVPNFTTDRPPSLIFSRQFSRFFILSIGGISFRISGATCVPRISIARNILPCGSVDTPI